MPLSPYVNQDAKGEEISASKVLKFGIDSAMMKAMTQKIRVIAAQVPTASQVRVDMCLVPRKILTYTYLEAS